MKVDRLNGAGKKDVAAVTAAEDDVLGGSAEGLRERHEVS
jgi:hypothetical protein